MNKDYVYKNAGYRPPAQHGGGFTMIEVLISIFITAIIGVMSYGGISSALLAQERNFEQSERLNELTTFMGIITRDLRQAIPRSVKDEQGDETEPAFYAPENAMFTLTFSRGGWQNPRPELLQRSSLQRVVYLLEEDKLIRQAWGSMDRTPETESSKVVLLKNVTSLNMRFLEPEEVQVTQVGSGVAIYKTPLGGKWQDMWPHPEVEQGVPAGDPRYDELPIAVEITVEVGGWGEIKRIVELPDVT